jgi:hypothetical protein
VGALFNRSGDVRVCDIQIFFAQHLKAQQGKCGGFKGVLFGCGKNKQGQGSKQAEQDALLQEMSELRKNAAPAESKGQAQYKVSRVRLRIFGENTCE